MFYELIAIINMSLFVHVFVYGQRQLIAYLLPINFEN